jgi:hypothetical protein
MNLKAFRSNSDPSTKRTPYAIYNGSGSPESSVTANVGDLFLQTDTGKVWVKETGTGNTGWVQVGPFDGFFSKSTFTIANNQSSATNLTGLSFSSSTEVLVRAIGRLKRTTSTTNLVEAIELYCIYDGSAWQLEFAGRYQDAGVEFSITSGGQVQYISTNVTGSSYVGSFELIKTEKVQA